VAFPGSAGFGTAAAWRASAPADEVAFPGSDSFEVPATGGGPFSAPALATSGDDPSGALAI
jgi:hypothetical protein